MNQTMILLYILLYKKYLKATNTPHMKTV